MKTTDDSSSVAMPPALLAEVEALATQEHRTAMDLVREAVEKYLEDRRWQFLHEYGEERARDMGLTEADIPRLIKESRQERKERQGD